MATVAERAEIGAETARAEGKGMGGQAVDAAKAVVTGRTGRPSHRRTRLPGHSRSVSRSGSSSDEEGIRRRGHGHHGFEGVRTVVSNESEAYCPNPNARNLAKEYETRVQVIQRYPEMRTVEKTDYVNEIVNEERTIIVPRTRVVLDEIQHVDRVPITRQVRKTRIEIVHVVVPEEREVTDMVPVIEYVDTPRIERVPRVIVEDIEEIIRVPVVREVPVTRTVEVPTGNYCEASAGEFLNPTHFNLLDHKLGLKNGGILEKAKSPSSSSSDTIAENNGAVQTTATQPQLSDQLNLDDTATSTSNLSAPRKKQGLLGRIINH